MSLESENKVRRIQADFAAYGLGNCKSRARLSNVNRECLLLPNHEGAHKSGDGRWAWDDGYAEANPWEGVKRGESAQLRGCDNAPVMLVMHVDAGTLATCGYFDMRRAFQRVVLPVEFLERYDEYGAGK